MVYLEINIKGKAVKCNFNSTDEVLELLKTINVPANQKHTWLLTGANFGGKVLIEKGLNNFDKSIDSILSDGEINLYLTRCNSIDEALDTLIEINWWSK